MTIDILHGDSRDVLKTLADNSIDSVVCDPPYALVSIVKRFGKEGSAPAIGNAAYARASAGFMGQQWDTGETAFAVEFWAEVMRVLKPGGHVVAFSGTRTYHRLAVAIEDSGFEIRDMLSWLYGSGFPKSHDVSKGIDKAAGAVREKVRVDSSEVRNPKATGGGKDGMDGATRPWIEAALLNGFHEKDSDIPATPEAAEWQGWGTALKPACEPIVLARKPLAGTVAGNVLLHGTGAINIDGCRVETDETITATRNTSLGSSGSGVFGAADKPGVYEQKPGGRWPANVIHDGSDEVLTVFPDSDGQQRDIDDKAPSAKTSGIYGKMNREGEASADRRYADKGSTDFAPLPGQRRGDSGSAARFFYTAKADATDRLGSKHPTIKPTDLMRWLCRLVTPPGGLILDPFAGSGSTGVAAHFEGFDAILIEREQEYVDDIHRRIAWAQGDGRLTVLERKRPAPKEPEEGDLF